jgi:hypothetical protein
MSYWACVQLEANRERLALHCLGLAGYQTYLPRIRVRRTTQSRKVSVQTSPLFPGYAFVLIELQWPCGPESRSATSPVYRSAPPQQVHVPHRDRFWQPLARVRRQYAGHCCSVVDLLPAAGTAMAIGPAHSWKLTATDIANLPRAFGHSADTKNFFSCVRWPKCLISLVGAPGAGLESAEWSSPFPFRYGNSLPSDSPSASVSGMCTRRRSNAAPARRRTSILLGWALFHLSRNSSARPKLTATPIYVTFLSVNQAHFGAA